MGDLIIRGSQAAASYLPDLLAASATSLVNQALFPQTLPGLQRPELEVQTSSDGAPMPRVWGRARLAGQVIWASRYREHVSQSGGKGGPVQTEYRYTVSFAVGLAEGEISGLGRVWANGALLDLGAHTHRLYTGDEAQVPDALIEAIEGTSAPAFRGTAYVVFEDMALDAFGGRIPNLSFEIYRAGIVGGALEEQVRGINLIPGSGEFALHPELVVRVLGPGREQAENRNNPRGVSDFLAALDDLERDLPQCRSVQLIVAWFGTDLRCSVCEIRPGVETRDKQTEPVRWSVAGQSRASAHLVSQIEGRPAYGGSPDDASVMAAIQALKARGFRVILYPFILMDIPPDNGLQAPQGDGEQPAFPWRGRITSQAPGDGALSADEQVRAFFGSARATDFRTSPGQVDYEGENAWRFNRFILHLAALAQAAGGVDGFLIGSELVALTCIRGQSGYPAVQALIALAAEVRSLLGPDVRLSYAADWSEYSGHQDGAGEKIFHLDPLWASPLIDAVAIDWYPPLSDWRAGDDHLDASIADGPDDPAYLRAHCLGGEGYDWYYASAADRDAQVRTPITDPDHGEAWIWRSKDLLSWWSNPHHDRPGGVRAQTPTAWQPGMKPVWLTEIGCPAVDKGSNQPNLFFDPKSDESALPVGSTGVRDDVIQRRALEALLAVWSGVGGMIEPDWIHVWCWDARPWPAFPARRETWSDGENWRLGHWLNGRAGMVPVGDIAAQICSDCGLTRIETSGLTDLVTGFVQSGPARGRDVIAPLLAALGIEAVERASAIHFLSAETARMSRVVDDLARAPGQPLERRVFTAPLERAGEVELRYLADDADYAPSLVRARSKTSLGERIELAADLVLDRSRATALARSRLQQAATPGTTRRLHLPAAHLALEAGDVVVEAGEPWRVLAVEGIDPLALSLVPHRVAPALRNGPDGSDAESPSLAAKPDLACLDHAETGVLLAASRTPWAGPVPWEISSESGQILARGQFDQDGSQGYLDQAFTGGPAGRWIEGRALEVMMSGGKLTSRARMDVLSGQNRVAIALEDGRWAVMQFARAELIAPDRYRLSDWLFGLEGSPNEFLVPPGQQIVLLDHAVAEVSLAEPEPGLPLIISAGTERVAQHRLTLSRWRLHPLSPVHLRWRIVAEADGRDEARRHLRLSWIRRTRQGGDAWWRPDVPLGEAEERYRVEVWQSDVRIWTAETVQPELSLALDAAGWSGRIAVRVAQLSDAVGAGSWARTQIDL